MKIELLLAATAAYLIGSFPSGLVLVWLLRGTDIRRYGSGKTGATNVARTLGWGPGLAVLGSDLLKGAAAVLVARALTGAQEAQITQMGEVLAGVAAVAGHCWPIYVGFRGGRGIATAVGTLFFISPPVAVAAVGLGIAAIALSDMVSLGSILGTLGGLALFLPLILTERIPQTYAPYALLCALLLLWQHRDNIQRILTGRERKLGARPKLAALWHRVRARL